MPVGKKNNAKYISDELYEQIINFMPIACVDLVVSNHIGEILLLKRKNNPAKGQWWFPGGRIHFMETRKEAALRKLREECGLVGEWVKDIGTFDVIMNEGNNPSHGITTVSLLKVAETKVQMDQQSLAYAWRSPNEWMEIVESDFVRMIFEKYILEANEQ